jgi:hypothetical protein
MVGRLVRTEFDKVDSSQGLKGLVYQARETGREPVENEGLMEDFQSRE